MRVINAESAQAFKLLEAIADSNERLIDLSCNLREKADVIEVLHGFNCRKYLTGTMVEGYVDAKLYNGKAICWWLDVHWEHDKWLIESSVLMQTDQGQEPIKRFPNRTAETIEGFVDELQMATLELVTSAISTDLTTY